MSRGAGVALGIRQIRYFNKAFWRNPASAFFTFIFPLMFLVIFTSLLGNGETQVGGRTVKDATYYVASMAAFSVITACYTNVAMGLAFQRDEGTLKRIRGTPIPPTAFLLARVAFSMLVALLLVTICATFGAALYGATIPSGATLLRFLAMLLAGAGSFAALGIAVTAIIPNADAAPPVVNATVLPLLFLSGIFIPIGDDAPGWITLIGKIFPVSHFLKGMSSAFLGTPFEWGDVLVVAIWGVAGLALAIRFFSWEPRS
ncbi:MAG: ABC transporter permease [Actinomycetota bacterium]